MAYWQVLPFIDCSLACPSLSNHPGDEGGCYIVVLFPFVSLYSTKVNMSIEPDSACWSLVPDVSPTRKKWDVINALSMILKFQTSILQWNLQRASSSIPSETRKWVLCILNYIHSVPWCDRFAKFQWLLLPFQGGMWILRYVSHL